MISLAAENEPIGSAHPTFSSPLMAKQYYLPATDGPRATWLDAFAVAAPAFAAKYGLTADDLAALTDGGAAFRRVLAARETFSNFVQSLTGYKNALRDGLPAGQTVAVPTLPTLDLGTAIEPGIFGRVTAVVNKIKVNPRYTAADGNALGIEGATPAARPADTIKPVLALRLAAGGQVEVVWKKDGHAALELQVDRGDTHGWGFLAVDTQPNYLDTLAPAAGQTAKWQYRAIYRDQDERVGQWSDAVSIAVAG